MEDLPDALTADAVEPANLHERHTSEICLVHVGGSFVVPLGAVLPREFKFC